MQVKTPCCAGMCQIDEADGQDEHTIGVPDVRPSGIPGWGVSAAPLTMPLCQITFRDGDGEALLGYGMTTVSAVVYSILVLTVRIATDSGAPLMLVLAVRFGAQTAAFACQMAAKRMPLRPVTRSGRLFWLAAGTTISSATALYMIGAALAPLGDAGALSGLYPVGTLIIARLWLHEPLGIAGIPSICLSAAGVTLISSGTQGEATALGNGLFRDTSGVQDEPLKGSIDAASLPVVRPVWGLAAALASSALNSVSYVTVRQAGTSMDALQWMLLYSMLGLLVTLPLCLQPSADQLGFSSFAPWAKVLPCLLAVGGWGVVAQTLLGYGQMMRGCRAGITALLSSSEIVWSYVLQVRSP